MMLEHFQRQSVSKRRAPRQWNCADKCVPKCNLGTRGRGLIGLRGRMAGTSWDWIEEDGAVLLDARRLRGF